MIPECVSGNAMSFMKTSYHKTIQSCGRGVRMLSMKISYNRWLASTEVSYFHGQTFVTCFRNVRYLICMDSTLTLTQYNEQIQGSLFLCITSWPLCHVMKENQVIFMNTTLVQISRTWIYKIAYFLENNFITWNTLASSVVTYFHG
jgi:hypothetical protein